jgi:hypothetical protein
MPQQQALALSLGHIGKSTANLGSLLVELDAARRAAHRCVATSLQTTDPLQALAGAARGAYPVEGQVQSDTPQPRTDFIIGSGLQLRGFGKLQKRFLKRVFGLHRIAQHAVHQAEELWVKPREERIEARDVVVGRIVVDGGRERVGLQHVAAVSLVVIAIHGRNTTVGRFSYISVAARKRTECQVGDGPAGRAAREKGGYVAGTT